jgi:protein-disulfide isomerase
MAEIAEPRLAAPVSERDHVQGPATARVTIVEYGDYECPYCRAAQPIVQELRTLLGDDLRYVFRHFPLTRVHPNAERAAEAAEAAGAQDRYFEMHALLFERQDALGSDNLQRYAQELGLDTSRFGDELASHAHVPRIRDDFRSGRASGVGGTPTFFIDDARYDGLVGVRQLLIAIRDRHPDVVPDNLVADAGSRPIPRVVSDRSLFG